MNLEKRLARLFEEDRRDGAGISIELSIEASRTVEPGAHLWIRGNQIGLPDLGFMKFCVICCRAQGTRGRTPCPGPLTKENATIETGLASSGK